MSMILLTFAPKVHSYQLADKLFAPGVIKPIDALPAGCRVDGNKQMTEFTRPKGMVKPREYLQ